MDQLTAGEPAGSVAPLTQVVDGVVATVLGLHHCLHIFDMVPGVETDFFAQKCKDNSIG
jgi:hypothetical protein